MDDVIANVSWDRLGVVGICVYATLAFVRGWIVPGSRVGEVRAHYEAELARLLASHEAVTGVQAALLATERERADKMDALNLRVMGYVEAGLKAVTVDLPREAS